MKNYDPNIMSGIHTVKITLQQWDCIGYVVMTIGGNCRGMDVINSALDILKDGDNITENPCKFSVTDEPDEDDNYYFRCVLNRPGKSDTYIEDDVELLEEYVVSIEIIDYEEK